MDSICWCNRVLRPNLVGELMCPKHREKCNPEHNPRKENKRVRARPHYSGKSERPYGQYENY